jgi:acyl-CoA reductase-like NAD-dependent aldehyde dehydrogenase
MDIYNPATGEKIDSFQEDTKESVEAKLLAAQTALRSWRKTSVKERIECVAKFAEFLKKNVDELGMELSLEVGKPLNEAKGEVLGAAQKCQFFIEQSEEFLREKLVNTAGNTKEVIAYEPLGVVANISAWNYPYLVGINVFIPALICGNAVLYKPSEYSTLVGKSIEKYLHQAGIPKDVFIGVYGAGEVGRALCELDLDGYFFTGSYATGRKIAEAVSHKLVPVGLELGGKDPLYVTDEVDVKNAAANAVSGVFYNNGQSCCSVERVYVHEKVYAEFLQEFITEAKKLKLGSPQEEGISLGAITRKEHIPFLENQVKDATNKGAKLELGGKRVEGAGAFYEPTVFTNVNHDMLIMTEETFGPVVGLMSVKDDNEATELMNDTVYGLTAAVFSDNQERARAILSDIDSGTGYINCCDRVSGYLPWSGRGHSGLGSTLSQHGLYAFCNPKAYHIRN